MKLLGLICFIKVFTHLLSHCIMWVVGLYCQIESISQWERWNQVLDNLMSTLFEADKYLVAFKLLLPLSHGCG